MEIIEYYKCDQCGQKFEVSKTQRLTTFVFHQPNSWTCPTCGRTTYVLNQDQISDDSIGGKISEVV